ncbi:uncharacterized protein JCM15063_000655 [Sporobolomyces koalae]|uniref:uncharacterized protein n=1 Tax=Sporobolomyces koalae TaxID=500713 RepID=UPI00316F54A0
MFGENYSESPRTPSPWVSRSLTTTPLQLLTPPATPPFPPASSPSCPTLSTATNTLDPRRGRKTRWALEPSASSPITLPTPPTLPPNLDSPLENPVVVSIETVRIPCNTLPALMPEVDETGHIEYKLKLSNPTSLHRLERLRTQLKWRLVQGGGTAIYELGVLDNGDLIGLRKEEMDESLNTLELMLRGLGGGTVKINRVIKILQNDHAIDSRDDASQSPPFKLDRTVEPFEGPDFSLQDQSNLSSISSSASTSESLPIDIPTTSTIKEKGPTPFPLNRTPSEQAEIKRHKRDVRRLKREQQELTRQQPLPTASSSSSTSSLSCSAMVKNERNQFNSHPLPIPPRSKPPKMPKPPRSTRRCNRSLQPRSISCVRGQESLLDETESFRGEEVISSGKPNLKLQAGEVRWVVEAIVEKRTTRRGSASHHHHQSRLSLELEDSISVEPGSDSGGSLQDLSAELSAATTISSSTEDEQDDEGQDEEVEGEEEGWNFLTFDLKELSASVKAAAAAAAVGTQFPSPTQTHGPLS